MLPIVRTLVATAVAILGAAIPHAAAQAIRTVSVRAADLAFSPMTGRLYASLPDADTVVEIDPVSDAVGVSIAVGSAPSRLAVSDTGEYLYVALDGLPGAVRVHLPTRTVGTPFTLGPPDPQRGPRFVDDMSVAPGQPGTVAIARRFAAGDPRHAGVAIYDNGVARPTVTPDGEGSTVVDYGATPSRLYGYNNETPEFGFRRMDVTPGGVTVLDSTTSLSSGIGLDGEYEAGRVYSTAGHVIDPEARAVLATLPGISPDDSIVEATPGRIYFVTGTSPSDDGVRAWHLKTFAGDTHALVNDWDLLALAGTPHSLVDLGGSTLAFAISDRVLIISPASLPQGDPMLSITTPTDAPSIALESTSVALAGTASDPDGSVTRVAWTSDRGYAGIASGTAQWFAEVPLRTGANVLTVTATDDQGHTRSATLTVTVAAYTAYLAEGATGNFFDYDLLLANPSGASVTADITFFTAAGHAVPHTVTLPAQSHRTVKVDAIPGLESTTMSTSVRTVGTPIVVERTMRWGLAPNPQYGAHSDKATAGSARTWYFAEGAQGFFYTYLLLANGSESWNVATVDWLVEGAPAQQRTYTLPPQSRTTIDAGADPALVGRSFGIVVHFREPAVAERAMYFGTPPEQLFKAGTDAAGVTAPSTRWILAEGATGPFFETFILLANPNAAPAQATLRFLTATGVSVTRTVNIAARGRTTVDIEALNPIAPELANAPVATEVTATLPIVAERAQYWPGAPSEWYEAHDSFGVTAARSRWGLAEGRVGNPPAFPPASYQTYILLANPGTTAANVTVTFLRDAGAPVVKTFTVAGGNRLNVAVAGPGSQVPELADEAFGAYVESSEPIVVERSLYGNAGGRVFDLGTNATGSPLP